MGPARAPRAHGPGPSAIPGARYDSSVEKPDEDTAGDPLYAARRIAVIGNSGAGKTTLSLQLATLLDLPLVHLDQEFWQPGWTKMPTAAWRARHSALVAADQWVIDGNFGSTMAERLASADLVVLVDCHPIVAWSRVVRRSLRQRGRTRADMAPGCVERVDLEFWRYVLRWRRAHGIAALALLDALPPDRVMVVRSNRERRALLARAASRT